MPGGAYNAGYALTGLAAAGTPPNEVTKALVQYLFKAEHKDGGWRIRTHRPPLEDSHFTATALAIKGIAEFAQPADKAEPTKRALAWLKAAEPKSTEDHAFKVLGLHWGDAKLEKQTAAKSLLALQNANGGWSQTTDMKSDAYATGLALSALRQSDSLSANSTQYKSGVKWLLDHQEPDGSWRVKTRSKPIQKYFESSFPTAKTSSSPSAPPAGRSSNCRNRITRIPSGRVYLFIPPPCHWEERNDAAISGNMEQAYNDKRGCSQKPTASERNSKTCEGRSFPPHAAGVTS